MLLRISQLLCRITINAGQIAANRQKDNVRNEGRNNETGVDRGMIKPDTTKYGL
jgi:hypothetical protein